MVQVPQWRKPSTESISVSVSAAKTLPPPDASPISQKAKEHKIHVSAAVLDAAGKDGDEPASFFALLLSSGLTQSEAERASSHNRGRMKLRKNGSEAGF